MGITENSIEFISNFECDEILFDERKLSNLRYVKDKLKKHSASYLSEWSHKFSGWEETRNGETIGYDYSKNLNLDDL